MRVCECVGRIMARIRRGSATYIKEPLQGLVGAPCGEVVLIGYVGGLILVGWVHLCACSGVRGRVGEAVAAAYLLGSDTSIPRGRARRQRRA